MKIIPAARAILILLAAFLPAAARAAEEKAPATRPAAKGLTVAVLDFDASLPGNPDFGKQLSDILATALAAEKGFALVDRTAMSHALAEQELNLTGLVDANKAIKIGHLVGANILVTGRVIPTDKNVIVTVKFFGTETSLVDAILYRGRSGQDSADLGVELASKVAAKLRESGAGLLAADAEDPLAALKVRLEGKKKPTISISIDEQHLSHVRVIDPPIDTELRKLLVDCGFTVIDKDQDAAKTGVSVQLKGEAVSEAGARVGNIISCSARVELKLVNFKDGKTLLADREEARAVDLAEDIGSKAALQKAAHSIGLRTLTYFADTLPDVKKKP